MKRVLVWAVRALAAVAVVLVLAFFFLTRTDTGAGVVVGQILKRLPLNGRIAVDHVKSRRLLEGVRLYGVRITGPSDRVFLTADSALLRYDWRTLVGGQFVLDRFDLYHPDVALTRYPGEDAFNAQTIFVSPAEADTLAAPPAALVEFDDARIVGGDVHVLYPLDGEPGPGVMTVQAPGGQGLLRRVEVHGLDVVLPRVVLSSPDVAGQLVQVDSLAAVAQVTEEPVTIRQLRGRVIQNEGHVEVQADRLALAGSELHGTFYVDMAGAEGEPLRYGFNGTAGSVDLADLQWLDPRIPEGTARGGFALAARGDEMTWTFNGAHLTSGGSAVALEGTVAMGAEGGPSFRDLQVELSPLALARLDPWLEKPLPLKGTVSGKAALSGTPDQLRAKGVLTLRRPARGSTPTTADFNGVLHLGKSLGFTGLSLTLDPLDYGVLSLLSDSLKLGGTGRMHVEATGDLADAIRFTADVDHRAPNLPASHVKAQGSVRKADGTYVLDVQGDLSPLSLTALRTWYPDLPVTGEVSGSVRAAGPLTDLRLRTDVTTEAGRLAVDIRLDATRPADHYSVVGQVADFQVSKIMPSLPQPTVFTGGVDVRGAGLGAATVSLQARLDLGVGSRVGGVYVDTAAVALRVADSVLHVDTLDAVAAGVDVHGAGTLAMEPEGPRGALTVAFHADSLAGLRPLLFGDSVVVRDELTPLDRELLILQGVNPDTLPTSAQVRIGGSVEGEVTLTGSVQDFSAVGSATFQRLAYGDDVVRGATLTFSGAGLPGMEGDLQGRLQADSLRIRGRAFAGADVEVSYTRPSGQVSIVLQRGGDEDYRARARFRTDSAGFEVNLDEMALRFDSLTWMLQQPTTLTWSQAGVRVEDLVLMRPGEAPLRIAAEGLLPTQGRADFQLHVKNLPLARVARLAQREDLGLAGLVDVDLQVRGTGAAPLVTGTVAARDVSYQDFSLSRVDADVDYADQQLRLGLSAWSDSLKVLSAAGTVPADLAFQSVASRFPDRPMDLEVSADSLPAAFVLAPIQNVSRVTGTVSGRFHIGGTVSNPDPDGTLALNDAGWFLDDLGVRYADVRGTLTLQSDGTVDVDAVARSAGTAHVTGTMGLEPLTDPSFQLDIALDGFEAADRPDVEGAVSGLLHLSGSYRRPVVTGSLAVDRGVMHIEEVVRAATVVDLSDPRYFEVVDTTLFSARPILEASQNPFMANLRVSVDMQVRQDTWIRSDQMNVEIGGDLIVTYDRATRDLVLVGDLQAARGSYSILGRTFQVQQGTVEFVGTSGINPNLSIQATTPVRQQEGQPITITATVSGTLENPHVELSSNETALSQSDLVSYLLFGRPSYALASSQAAIAAGAAGSLVEAGLGATASVLSGTVANRLSALLARQWGFLDYFAITQTGDFGVGQGSLGLSSFENTVVELGSYVGQDLFLTFLLKPFLNTHSGSQFAGVRLEWQASTWWSVRGFFEDRFLQGQPLGFQQIDYTTNKVGGFLLSWERGY